MDRRAELYIEEETWELLPEKALWHPASRTMVLADVHFGKAMHFRKSGIALPITGPLRDIEVLERLFSSEMPETVVFLGDLFHSDYNAEWDMVGELIGAFPATKFLLVKGNHDIMPGHYYRKYRMDVTDAYQIGRVLFTHEPPERPSGDFYHIYGHIHPGVVMTGKGLQALKIPCLLQGPDRCIMPAFGGLTGLQTVRPVKTEKIFAFAEDKIICLGG